MNIYRRLASDEFVQLYSVIHRGISEGDLSNAMYHELTLIQDAAAERCIKIIKLNKKPHT